MFSDTWNDTENFMLCVVATLSGHARRMANDKTNERAPLRKALAATAESLRQLRERVAKLMGDPRLAAETLSAGLTALMAEVPVSRIDGALLGIISQVAFDPPLPAQVGKDDVVVEG